MIRPVFVDPSGRRRRLLRASAAAVAAGAFVFMAGAGALLTNRPLTSLPGLLGEAVTGQDTGDSGGVAAAPRASSPPVAGWAPVPGRSALVPLRGAVDTGGLGGILIDPAAAGLVPGIPGFPGFPGFPGMSGMGNPAPVVPGAPVPSSPAPLQGPEQPPVVVPPPVTTQPPP
ncbi:hypothetical protein FNH06_32535, partial [Amycolatopsis acidiphila]